MIRLPADHPLRTELNDEVHARPYEPLASPSRLSYLAIPGTGAEREAQWRHLGALARSHGLQPPGHAANHLSIEFGTFRLRWEQHTEFSRYTFIVDGPASSPYADPAIAAVPLDWIAALPGRVIVAAHALVLPAPPEPPEHDALAGRYFAGHGLIGAGIAGGAGTAYTDLRIHADGFSRFLIHDATMGARQTGRMVQRLLEIETYRVMALLALPVARELGPFLSECEQELAAITTALARAESEDESALLDRLMRLEASLESREAANNFRFGAASAYYEIVRRRIVELREVRIQGLQTFQEFTERRLAPAMNTCETIAARQQSLSARMARATQLLSTRVDVTRERQNQALLESMNRRSEAQLRLQQTVEGLSVAAITYYIVGLLGYLAKGLKAAGLAINPELAVAIGIPIVAVIVALGVRRIRHHVTRAAP